MFKKWRTINGLNSYGENRVYHIFGTRRDAKKFAKRWLLKGEYSIK